MPKSNFIHLMYCPWTGLGLYQGFRGNRFLRNRIQIFKQFVLPSLQNQTSKNFVLWCSWRPEEKRNLIVREFIAFLEEVREFKTVHTFHGVCFWDDKYPDDVARDRLLTSLHGSIAELLDTIGEVDYIYLTIQPSDDCYHRSVVHGIQAVLNEVKKLQAFGFKQGYIINYATKELADYNPTTNPPFFTIKFPRDLFVDPLKHAKYTGPYKSHEYIGNYLNYGVVEQRAFLVGTHFDNISTAFDHPYKGTVISGEEKVGILRNFGILEAKELKVPLSLGRLILQKLPHRVKRKLRYWAGEKNWIFRPIFAMIYNILRA